jgi:hypothetical protein
MAREQSPKISDPIFAGLVEGENTLLWAQKSSGKTNGLLQIFKTSWRDEWNQLKDSPSEIAHYLIASTTTPGLGLRPRDFPDLSIGRMALQRRPWRTLGS